MRVQKFIPSRSDGIIRHTDRVVPLVAMAPVIPLLRSGINCKHKQ
jgi:hypothetical protein